MRKPFEFALRRFSPAYLETREWIRRVRQAYARPPVLGLGVIGLVAMALAPFTTGYWQAVLIQVGAALALIPPIVVTERIAVGEQVRELRNQVMRMASAQDVVRTQADNLDRLFVERTDYLGSDLLVLMKAALNAHVISKWGIAVPLVKDDYKLMLGLRLGDEDASVAHYLPSYVVDAQDRVMYRLLYEQSKEEIEMRVVVEWGMIGGRLGGTTTDALLRTREVLLEEDLHPPFELDFVAICDRIRETLLAGFHARQPGPDHRTGIGAILTLIGGELAVTLEGIEHLYNRGTQPIDLISTWRRANLRQDRPRDDFDDGEWEVQRERRVFESSGFEDHSDVPKALTAIRVLYLSGFLTYPGGVGAAD